MVESHDELLMEIAWETGLDRMDEDEEGDEEETDDEGDVAAPPAAAPPPLAPPAVVPEEIHEEGPMEAIPEQEDLKPHEVTTTEVESETPQHRLYHALMRAMRRTRSGWRMISMIWIATWMETAPMRRSRMLRMVVMVGIESLVLSLRFRNTIKLS
jgi:hypothetical protein